LKLIARFGGGKVLTDVVGGVDKFLKSKIAPLSGSIAPGTSIPSQFMLKTRSLIDVGVKVAKLQRSATRRLEDSGSKYSRKIFYFSIQPEVLEATWC
jgi:hypothetical protein